jgi:hypothetical protein
MRDALAFESPRLAVTALIQDGNIGERLERALMHIFYSWRGST